MSKYRITLNGQVYEMEIEAIEEGTVPAQPQTAASETAAAPTADSAPVHAESEPADNAVISPMPGTVVRLMAAQGDTVTKGQPVLVLEAMKMENEITAVKGGVISAMYVAEGQTVSGGEALFEIG